MLLAWLRLARASLAPSIVWDWAAGILLCGLAWRAEYLILLFILLAIYHGGMIANDLCDRAIDQAAGRQRPLTSGQIKPRSAWLALLFLWGGALAVAALLQPAALTATGSLIAIAALYDFGGPIARAALGPVLLALARAGSLFFVAFAEFGLRDALTESRLAAAAAYALYFLFLARLARREESGAPGGYGFVLVAFTAIVPSLLLMRQPTPWLAAGAWLIFAILVVRPALADARRSVWPPSLVRVAVRRGLGFAPLVPGLAILAAPAEVAPAWALLAVAAMMSVRALSRVIPPE
jgi:hypothetical protein